MKFSHFYVVIVLTGKMKKKNSKVGYFSKTAEIFSTAMTAQSDQKPSTFCFKVVIFNFIDFSIAKVGRPSQSCAENYFQMILLLLVLLGHKVVSSLGALLGQPRARCPSPAAHRARPPWAGRPAACRPAPSLKNLKLIQEVLMTHDKVL